MNKLKTDQDYLNHLMNTTIHNMSRVSELTEAVIELNRSMSNMYDLVSMLKKRYRSNQVSSKNLLN